MLAFEVIGMLQFRWRSKPACFLSHIVNCVKDPRFTCAIIGHWQHRGRLTVNSNKFRTYHLLMVWLIHLDRDLCVNLMLISNVTTYFFFLVFWLWEVDFHIKWGTVCRNWVSLRSSLNYCLVGLRRMKNTQRFLRQKAKFVPFEARPFLFPCMNFT